MQIAVLILGAAFAAAGIVLFAKMGTGGENTVKILGAEFKLAGSALVIFVVGCVLIIAAMNGAGRGPSEAAPLAPTPPQPSPLKKVAEVQRPQGHAVGIDISSQDQVEDWATLKSESSAFVIMNATQGVQATDAKFVQNWQQAKAAGIVRGAYHFFVTSQDPEQQAKHFCYTANFQPGDLPPILAVVDGSQGTSPVSDAVLEQGVAQWLKDVQFITGRQPIILTTKAFWDAHITGDFSRYDLWLGGVSVDPPEDDASALALLPKGWKTWKFWKSPNNIPVDGIQPAVSTDLFNGPSQDLQNYVAGSSS